MSRTILYAEVPGFYAEAERSTDPALAERPVIVGGDPRKRGTVQAATADAAAVGVVEGMPVLDALERCPRARALRTRMPFYREVSLRLRATLARGVEGFERDGIAAAWFDVTDDEAPEKRARALQQRVRDELRLPLRIGIAPSKPLARIAAQAAGGDGLRCVKPGEEVRFLAPLPLSEIPFIGPNGELRLAQAGARTVGEALALGLERLEELLGNRARELVDLAGGQGDAHVRAEAGPRSLSQEATLDAPASDRAALHAAIARIAERLEAALRIQGLATRRVGLKLRHDDERTVTRSKTLTRSVSQRADLEAIAQELLVRTDAGDRPVRLLGLTLSRLGRARRDGRQLDLFGQE